MMTGLSLLMFLAYYLRKTRKEGELEYEIFSAIKLVEWDTLLFYDSGLFHVGGGHHDGKISPGTAQYI